MKKSMLKVLTATLVLAIFVGTFAGVYAKTYPSNAFRLPEVKVRATVEPTAEPVVEAVTGPATSGEADVRVAADGLSEIFVTLAAGVALNVLAVEGDWAKVDVDGQIGYIYKDSVTGVEFPVEETPENEQPVKKVTIFSSRRSVVNPGESIYLTSKLEGFENSTIIIFQWQCDRGNGFEDVPGATAESYSFEADIETLGYDWRLQVLSN